ncbi:MAG TPA: enoyl-CoA hydratase/isomerase family protein [Thermoanaerobaculaceae bacterium]|nr:enoyl-CoA hydratase/isomerase family protein [Thermoanaerobaculaceae bacterium]
MPTVNLERRGALALVELARPESGNALSAGLVADLHAALAAAAESGARALILAGSGRNFCAGADLRELAATADAPLAAHLADANRLAATYAALLRCPLLTVAAVHGAAYGGGAGLAAACDLVVASPAARFQFSEVRLGFVPALVSAFLPRRVAPATLARLLLDPEPLAAAAAREAGLVDEIADDARAAAGERALAIVRKAAPSALAETKRLLLAALLPQLDRRLAEAAEANARQRTHPDCRRGVAAFLASREFPDWTA